MSTFIAILLSLFGVFLFSWTLWRRLREDYPSDDIFSFTLGILTGIFLGVWISDKTPLSLFWYSVAGAAAAGTYFARRFGLRVFELLDALSASWFYLSLFLFLAASLTQETKQIFWAYSGVSLASLFLHRFFEKRYRRFSWYPSGRVGFVGLASIAVYFFLRGVVEIGFVFMLSSEGEFLSVIVSLVVALSLVTILYLRSGNKRAEAVLDKLKWQTK